MKTALNALVVTLVSASAAHSVEMERFFGHEIRVTGEAPEVSLEIDGRSVLKDAIISISQVAVVAGVPTLIGESSTGGNACDGSPFVISFPADGMPRLDGPIDACASLSVDLKADRLEFYSAPLPGRDGERWAWTPAEGLKTLSAVGFTPDANKGWNSLRERTLQHPGNVFEYGEIGRQIDSLLGADKPIFLGIIVGVGGGEFKGDDYVGTSCTPHMCDSTGAIVYLSTKDRKAYVAWKPDGKKIVVRPEVKQWPEKPRHELKAWAEKWQ